MWGDMWIVIKHIFYKIYDIEFEKRLSPKELHHITPTSPRIKACNHVSFLICLILYTPILFDQKLIKIVGIIYTPILFDWFV